MFISSGEPLAAALQAKLTRALLAAGCSNVRVLNLYGTTEVAADCTFFDTTLW